MSHRVADMPKPGRWAGLRGLLGRVGSGGCRQPARNVVAVMVSVPITDRQYLPASGGSRCARYPGVRTDENQKSRAPLALGWFMKVASIVRVDVNRARIVYDTLVIASAKTARAFARRKPAPKLSTRLIAVDLVGLALPHSELPDA